MLFYDLIIRTLIRNRKSSLKGYVALRRRQVMYCFFRCYLLMPLIRIAFKRLHYPVVIIVQCVRWYLAYSLSLRNLEEMMAELGIVVDHSTLHRWVIRLVPLLNKAFRRHKRAVGCGWRMDETYIKVRGQWKYLYRAVDTSGQTIDFLLAAKRDTAAALRFFRKAIRHHGEPEVVTIDTSGANTAALTTLNADKPEEETITVRQNKYLNNLVEQDHRNIKRRIARENTVLNRLLSGNNPKRIAKELGLSHKTVSAHKLAALRKLGVNILQRFILGL